MRVVTMFTAAVAALGLNGCSPRKSAESDRAAVMRVLHDMEAAWARYDYAAIRQLVAPDAAFIEYSLPMSLDSVIKIFRVGQEAGVRQTFVPREPTIRLIGDAAFVAYALDVTIDGDSVAMVRYLAVLVPEAPYTNPYRVTAIESFGLERQGGEWKVAMLHATALPSAAAPAAANR